MGEHTSWYGIDRSPSQQAPVRDRTGITYIKCKEHELSMYTPAPVFEHGRCKQEYSSKGLRGEVGSINLCQKPYGGKRQRKNSNLDGNQHNWCQMTTTDGLRSSASCSSHPRGSRASRGTHSWSMGSAVLLAIGTQQELRSENGSTEAEGMPNCHYVGRITKIKSMLPPWEFSTPRAICAPASNVNTQLMD